MRENTLKQKLQQGETVLGLFMNCSYPAFIEIAGLAGYDFAIIDLEHGPLEVETAEDLCRGAQAVGLSPIVRVGENNPSRIQRALDIGSAGVQIPQIETQAQAEAAVRAAKYSPHGLRGLSFYTRAGDYMVHGSAGVTDALNEQQIVIIHVEGIRGIENLDEIIAVPHLDVIFLGPYDLSQSLGIPGQVQDPRVQQSMEVATAHIRAAGKAVGTFAANPETARRWINVGIQYVAVGVDVGLFAQVCRETVAAVRGAGL
jgi:4-hydroxy-2-oxoheptanedioate aldolase